MRRKTVMMPKFENGYCLSKESNRFEAKSARGGVPKNVWETYSALANSDGGIIILGLVETERGLMVQGIPDVDEKVQSIWNTLNNREKVSSNLLCNDDVKVLTVDGLDLISISVPRAEREDRPVYIDNNFRNTFRRDGEGDFKCDLESIRSMIADSGASTPDRRIVDTCTIDELNKDSIKSYRNELRSARPDHEWLKLDDTELLRRLGAASFKDGVLRPTLAGLLMFGNDYCITEDTPSFRLDYRECLEDGSWTRRILSSTGDWSGNVYDFYGKVIAGLRTMVPRRLEIGSDLKRVEDSKLDMVLREAVLNSLIHADYSGRGGIVIESRMDRITVSNPGTFRIPIERAEIGGYSDPRNQSMAKMFMLIGDAENAGSGVSRMMTFCRELGIPAPDIAESYDPPRTTVTVLIDGDGLRNDDITDRVVDLMREDPRISISSISRKLDVPRHRVEYVIRGMKEDGTIRREGGTRGEWVVCVI